MEWSAMWQGVKYMVSFWKRRAEFKASQEAENRAVNRALLEGGKPENYRRECREDVRCETGVDTGIMDVKNDPPMQSRTGGATTTDAP